MTLKYIYAIGKWRDKEEEAGDHHVNKANSNAR